MVSPERALEHMSVDNAWTLLDTLSSQVIAKQTELQVGLKERNRAFVLYCVEAVNTAVN